MLLDASLIKAFTYDYS